MRLQYSIDINDRKHLESGDYNYSFDIIPNPPMARIRANVRRVVKAEPPREVAGCRFSSVTVSEILTSEKAGWYETLEYVWYPELKMRVILRLSSEISLGSGKGYDNKIRYYVVTALKVAN